MSLAVISSYALLGLKAHPVQVEVYVGPGLPCFNIVGLPGAGVRESRDRVRAAIINSGFEFPAGRITANLAPADLPKDSGRFDLAIAIGVLLASGQLVLADGLPPKINNLVLIGELSLTGSLVPTGSALVIALSIASKKPDKILIMATGSARIAALVPGLQVLQADSLLAVTQHLCGHENLHLAKPINIDTDTDIQHACLSDVRGQQAARTALEAAAAGGHSLLMLGTPGVGKSMLAQRLPGILPDLSAQYALESAAVYSLVQDLTTIPKQPPFRAPHHGCSMPALVGGGSYPRPGEISLAHRGVLFLDELPEFERRSLEALREPLESGYVTIARASGSYQFPAKFQLIAAMNPCPCGWLGHIKQNCRCSPESIVRYRAKVSGPLMDRIDIHVNLAVEGSWLLLKPGETSAVVKKRVIAARMVQMQRQSCLNNELSPAQLQMHVSLAAEEQNFFNQMVVKWGWSTRAMQRCLRLARTFADLASSKAVDKTHIAMAAQFRANDFYC